MQGLRCHGDWYSYDDVVTFMPYLICCLAYIALICIFVYTTVRAWKNLPGAFLSPSLILFYFILYMVLVFRIIVCLDGVLCLSKTLNQLVKNIPAILKDMALMLILARIVNVLILLAITDMPYRKLRLVLWIFFGAYFVVQVILAVFSTQHIVEQISQYFAFAIESALACGMLILFPKFMSEHQRIDVIKYETSKKETCFVFMYLLVTCVLKALLNFFEGTLEAELFKQWKNNSPGLYILYDIAIILILEMVPCVLLLRFIVGTLQSAASLESEKREALTYAKVTDSLN